jgi:outer membrane beta-barrel protein
MFGISLQDEFSRDLFFGLRAEYFFTDNFGIGVMGAVAPVHIDTSLTDQVAAQSPGGTANVPIASNFPQQVGRRNWMADVHLTFVPLRGKFALFQSLVADVDFFLFAGAAFVGISERQDTSISTDQVPGDLMDMRTRARSPTGLSQTARSSRVAIAPTIGAGLNFFVNHFISLNFEYRVTPFTWNPAGTDESSAASTCGLGRNESCDGNSDYVSTYFDRPSTGVSAPRRTIINEEDRLWRFNQMFTFGLTFYLPTAPRIGP